MNYKEALELSLNVRWKTDTCVSGSECWCRVIRPENNIIDEEGNEVYIVGQGSITKEHAEHIVKLHNLNLDK